jgi:hypothetical protein
MKNIIPNDNFSLNMTNCIVTASTDIEPDSNSSPLLWLPTSLGRGGLSGIALVLKTG